MGLARLFVPIIEPWPVFTSSADRCESFGPGSDHCKVLSGKHWRMLDVGYCCYVAMI